MGAILLVLVRVSKTRNRARPDPELGQFERDIKELLGFVLCFTVVVFVDIFLTVTTSIITQACPVSQNKSSCSKNLASCLISSPDDSLCYAYCRSIQIHTQSGDGGRKMQAIVNIHTLIL